MCCRIGGKGAERETSACFDEFDEISWAFNKFIICLRHNLHHLINFFPSSSPIVICGIWFLRKYLQSTWSGSCESCEWDALDIWLCLFFRLSPNDFPLSAAKIEKKLVNFNEQKRRRRQNAKREISVANKTSCRSSGSLVLSSLPNSQASPAVMMLLFASEQEKFSIEEHCLAV